MYPESADHSTVNGPTDSETEKRQQRSCRNRREFSRDQRYHRREISRRFFETNESISEKDIFPDIFRSATIVPHIIIGSRVLQRFHGFVSSGRGFS